MHALVAMTTSDPAPAATEELTGADTRQWNMLIQRAVSLEIIKAAARMPAGLPDLPPELFSTDRINERWAVGHGSGLPWSEEDVSKIAEADQLDTFTARQSKPPPLDDETQTIIDQIVGPNPKGRALYRPERAAPPSVSRFVWEWYCEPITCVTMAQQRRMNPDGLQLERVAVLSYLRRRYLESGHADLVALVRTVI